MPLLMATLDVFFRNCQSSVLLCVHLGMEVPGCAQIKGHMLNGALQYPLCTSHMLDTPFLAGLTTVKYKLNIHPMTRNCVVTCLISLSCWPAGSKWADLCLHCSLLCQSYLRCLACGSGFMRICGKNMCLKACAVRGMERVTHG